jgi:histidinol-phosphate aminotransferase
MGLLDYYRQFEGMSEEEVNEGLREEAAERRRKALARVETLDLSLTTWPELPHPHIVSAITFVARRGMHRYPQLGGDDLRARLAERHGVDPERCSSRGSSCSRTGRPTPCSRSWRAARTAKRCA